MTSKLFYSRVHNQEYIVLGMPSHICGIHVSVLVSSPVHYGFDPRSDKTKLTFAASPLSMQPSDYELVGSESV